MHRSPFIFDCSRFIGQKKLQASQRECSKPCTIPLDLTRMKKIEAIIAPTEFEAVREGNSERLGFLLAWSSRRHADSNALRFFISRRCIDSIAT